MSNLYECEKLSKEEHDFLLQFLDFNLYDLKYYDTEKNTNNLREKFEAQYQSAFNDLNLHMSNEIDDPLHIIIVHSHIRLLNTTNFHGENYKSAVQDLDNQIKPEQEIIIPHPDVIGYLSLEDGCANILARQSWKGIYMTALKQAGLWLTHIRSGLKQSTSKFGKDFKTKWTTSMEFLNEKVDSLIKSPEIEKMVGEVMTQDPNNPSSVLFSSQTNLKKKIYETGFTFKEFFPGEWPLQ